MKIKLGKMGRVTIYSSHSLPWDVAKLISGIAKAGEGEYDGKIECHKGVWTINVYLPVIGMKSIPTNIEEIWEGVNRAWKEACIDCGEEYEPLDINHQMTQPWAYPQDVEERIELVDYLLD